VPDIYQGCELAGFQPFVDPDNRRPVDFERAPRSLEDVDEELVPMPSGRSRTGCSAGRICRVETR
jgi:maltooligosyltrehalose synthase